MVVASSARFHSDSISCVDLAKPNGPISTGIGFLDHMVDQFNSHAQIGVSITVSNFDEQFSKQNGDKNRDEESEQGLLGLGNDHNRHAKCNQAKLLHHVGAKLGAEFKRLLKQLPQGASSYFACPLDEALVECTIRQTGSGSLSHYTLEPYGAFPKPHGRTHLGKLETNVIIEFWKGLAQHAQLEIQLNKVRGTNAHHIVESSFKAFCRALRNLLDGVDTGGNTSAEKMTQLFGPESANFKQSLSLDRKGSVKRETKETSIQTVLRLDGGHFSAALIDTGIKTLDTLFLKPLAKAARQSWHVTCRGDLHIDEHHTAEDVAIACGQALTQAIGSKAGCVRMWCSKASVGTCTARVVMDLSNRPCLTHDIFEQLSGGRDWSQDELIDGDLSMEMLEHVLESLVMNARMTVHICVNFQAAEASNQQVLQDLVQALAQAFGTCLCYCSMVDVRRAGATASSKGTLSV